MVAGVAFLIVTAFLSSTLTLVTAGSFAGTKLRNRLPERVLKRILKGLVRLFVLRRIVQAWL